MGFFVPSHICPGLALHPSVMESNTWYTKGFVSSESKKTRTCFYAMRFNVIVSDGLFHVGAL